MTVAETLAAILKEDRHAIGTRNPTADKCRQPLFERDVQIVPQIEEWRL